MKSKSKENKNKTNLNVTNPNLLNLSFPNQEEKIEGKNNSFFKKEDNLLFEKNKNSFNFVNDYCQIQNKIKVIENNNKSFNQNYSIIHNDIKNLNEEIYELNNNTLNILSKKK